MSTSKHRMIISPVSIAELVEQYNHRLLSLELDLKGFARANQIGVRDFEQRARALQKLRGQIQKIKDLNSLDLTPTTNSASDLGMPSLSSMTNLSSIEVGVFDRFLKQKLELVSELEKNSRLLANWLREAISGETSKWRLTLRLSKLKRLIHSYENRSKSASEDVKTLDRYINQFIKGLGKKIPVGFSRSNVDATIGGLVHVFSDLDTIIARVAKLKATEKQERQRIHSMLNWLAEYERRVLSRLPTASPPSPMAVAKAHAAIPKYRHDFLEKNRKRLFLAKDFIYRILHKEQWPTTLRPDEITALLLDTEGDSDPFASEPNFEDISSSNHHAARHDLNWGSPDAREMTQTTFLKQIKIAKTAEIPNKIDPMPQSRHRIRGRRHRENNP